jgi:hypothetical protein
MVSLNMLSPFLEILKQLSVVLSQALGKAWNKGFSRDLGPLVVPFETITSIDIRVICTMY